jgi:anti-sigma-K factor RskA
MRCQEVAELAGSYALGALTPEEQADVERHLSGCSKHADIADLVASAERLSVLPPEMEPPPALKTRLMDAVHADVAADRADASPAPAAPKQGLLQRLFGGPRTGFAVAAVAAAAVVALVIVSPWGGDGEDETLVRTFDEGGIRAEVQFDPDDPSTTMTVEGLEPAPAGSVYQVWAVTGASPVSIGFLEVPEDGAASAEMDVQLVEGQVVAVTVEPEGGSPLPTTEPVFGIDI